MIESEGLQAVYSEESQGLQATQPEPGLERYRDVSDAYLDAKQLDSQRPDDRPYKDDQVPRKRKIFGLSIRILWLVVGLLGVLILAAIIGGAVGGTRAKTKSTVIPSGTYSPSSALGTAIPQVTSSLSPNQSSTPTTLSTAPAGVSTSPPTTTTNQQPISSTTEIGPDGTAIRDCPSSNNSIYTVPISGISASEQFLKVCNTTFLTDNPDAATQNFVELAVDSLDDCIGACASWNQGNHISSSGLSQTCNVVCWRPYVSGSQGRLCFGYAASPRGGSVNDLGSYSTVTSDNCDSALWVNEPS
ncbi:MAG: hypothetical protein MMC33_009302 [Icmadophila ericetorum]|nr:hypothetical protein [Icmadophila ericetorum]